MVLSSSTIMATSYNLGAAVEVPRFWWLCATDVVWLSSVTGCWESPTTGNNTFFIYYFPLHFKKINTNLLWKITLQ